MNLKSLRILACLAVALGAAQALADEGDLVEKVAVRNRLFTPAQRFELGGNVGVSILSRLTDHYNLNLSAAYNLTDWLGLELRGGYAISRHTSLADQIQIDFAGNSSIAKANDLSDLWELTANAVVGVRFQPIYGKINLMSELPVHFQLYGWIGGGFGLFKRQSLVICTQRVNTKECGAYFEESSAGPLVSIAMGFRFWPVETWKNHSFKVEVRDYSYLDSYYIDVVRDQVTVGNPTAGGKLNPAAGVTNLVQIDLGYAFIF